MIYLISGIDTGIGKTRATAELGRFLQKQGRPFVTAKLVQTGCTGISEDILEHRRLLEQQLLPEDRDGITCPYVFSFPGSPHLAAALEKKTIDLEHIVRNMRLMEQRYGTVLCEGAGGLMVPLLPGTTILDLAARELWPVILVSSPRLGSLNHTLLSLYALQSAGCTVTGIVYNRHGETDTVIGNETARYLRTDARIASLVELHTQSDSSDSIHAAPDFSVFNW